MASPPIIRDFLTYSSTIKGKSKLSVEEYYFDLTTFFKYIKLSRGLSPSDKEFQEIDFSDIDESLVKTITISDLLAFLVFCKEERDNNAATRARKASTLRVYFRYLTNTKHILSDNPAVELETPKTKKSLPRFLTLEESLKLLSVVDGDYKERDYCIITFFLNCGMRLSELCSLNLTSFGENGSMTLLGKGNKERTVYLNQACIDALEKYLPTRPVDGVLQKDKNALFLSKFKKRISNKTVQHIVYSNLEKAGLGDRGLSVHKLRHTAATLMYQHGNVDIRILKDILGHANLGTTQIYTHISDSQIKKAIDSNPLGSIKSENK
jgi:site-specific recombinase XerD